MTMTFIASLLTAALLFQVGPPPLEEGATFDGGICWEADGTEGISSIDGQCVTPADYDAIYSYENLNSIVGSRPGDEGRTIAEIYNIQPEDDPASDRPIGVDLSDDNRTFSERVAAAHTPHLPVAD